MTTENLNPADATETVKKIYAALNGNVIPTSTLTEMQKKPLNFIGQFSAGSLQK